jgi:phosphate-selective porin
MGPVMYTNGAHAVDAEFDSYFALLSRAYGRHRLSVRYDNFEVTQNDQTPADDNRESGHAVTVSWQLGVTDKVSVVAESVTIKSRRDIWMSFGLEPDETETQFQLSLRLRL